MPEQHPDHSPDERTDQEPQETPETPAPNTADTEPTSTTAETPQTPPAAAGRPDPTAATGVGGRRVTRRTVDRSEITEHTVETITEEIPPEYYQSPTSTHPAPVG